MSSASGSGERILAILDLFSEDRPEWTTDELMQESGYTRTTLYRYLKTLKDAGYLVSLPGFGFTLGPRVTELDFLMQGADPLISSGEPFLRMLAQRHPCSVFITRWYERKILCVVSVEFSTETRSSYPRGRPMPLGRGAISRAIIASLPRREQNYLIADFLEDLGGPGASEDRVRAELRSVRREGVCVARDEVTPGVIGVAAPVLVSDRTPIAALCVTSAASQVDEERLETIRHDVKISAEAMSEKLQIRFRESA